MVNEWTRDDLPSVIKSHRYGNVHFSRIQEVEAYKDDVVDHLNANHPKPAPGLLSSAADCVLDAEDRARSAKADADRWRRAHEIVEGERDLARDRCRELERERDEAWRVAGEQARLDRDRAEAAVRDRDRAEAAERERDEWKSRTEAAERERDGAMQARNTALVLVSQAQDERDEALDRAEAAEARLADPYSPANQDSAAWCRVAAHPALRMDLLPEADHTYAGRVFERITWLAEAAEARTAPAVTKAEVGKVVREAEVLYGVAPERVTDAVWSLVSGADPAVHVVRESDVAAVEVVPYGDTWKADGRVHLARNAAAARTDIRADAVVLARSLAVARAIEAEAGQDVDPVEDAAVAAFKAAWHRADEEGDEGNRVRRGIRAARDVLGQEAGDA